MSKKYQLNIDEHVFAALNLYLDIINLFLYILSISSDFKLSSTAILTFLV